MLGWVIAAFTVTIATSLARSNWPGLSWLGITLALNLAGVLSGLAPDPAMPLALGNFLIHVAVFMIVRMFRGEVGRFGTIIGWQIGSFTSFAWLTFFDGYDYNAWNWLIAIPANLFLSEIWPIYWAILRPLLG